MSTKTQQQLTGRTSRKIVTPLTGALSLVIGGNQGSESNHERLVDLPDTVEWFDSDP